MVVELTWVMELTWEGESLRFTLPTTIAPRYAPEADRKASARRRRRRSTHRPRSRSLRPRVHGRSRHPGGIAGIESPSHPLRWRPRGDGATVELSHETAAMNEDLVLLIAPRAPRQPHVIAERQVDGSLVAAVSFLPKLEAGSRAPREVIFIMDRSARWPASSIGRRSGPCSCACAGCGGGSVRRHRLRLALRADVRREPSYDQENLDAATKWVERSKPTWAAPRCSARCWTRSGAQQPG